jgi:hypothetical protein
MKGYRKHPMGSHALDDKPLGQQLRQGARQPAPPFVLEPVDRKLDWALVRDCRAQPRKRSEARAAATLPLSGLDLHPTTPAHRFLEAPNPRPALLAQPRTDHTASAASRGQDEVDGAREHAAKVPRRSTASLQKDLIAQLEVDFRRRPSG